MGVISHILDTRVIPDIQIVDEVRLKSEEETELHMGVRKKDRMLRDILQKGLDALTTVEARELRHRWLPFTAAAGGKFHTNELDILPAVARTEEREKFLNFTKPYISFPVVIATQKDGGFVDNLNDLLNKKVGVIADEVTREIIAADHPDLMLLPPKSLAAGLKALNKGELTAFIDDLGSITYGIQRYKLNNIKIAAPTKYRFDLSFGVRKDWPQLVEILDKALDTIDERERATIKGSGQPIKNDKPGRPGFRNRRDH